MRLPYQVQALRLLTILEATTLTAVAKNVLSFYRGLATLNVHNPLGPIEMSIVTFDRLPSSNSHPVAANEFVASASEHGIEIEVVRERFRFDTNVLSALRRIVAQRDPDVIATHNVKSHFLTRACHLHHDRSWVAFHHGYTSTDLKMRAYNQLDRWSLVDADRVVTVCQAFVQLLQQRGIARDRISVQHNAIGPELPLSAQEGAEVRKRFSIDPNDRLILNIGRLSREKGHVELIAAFAELRLMHPQMMTKLLIVGEGPEAPAIKAAIRTHTLEDYVQLAGYSCDVRPFYAAADVFALPSLTEGSPYVLFEAMTAGVPIAATAVGGVPEILTNEKTALLAAPQDSKSLAFAISRILRDDGLGKLIAANSHALVAERYSLESYVRCISGIYHSVATQKRRRRMQEV